ncbi:hypothetical protein C6501_07295 [Candidatus Poribacteria bacterium]|nr:MAG: hypothetical protein C6501_07295 [Candidatus Poribacteria bacterium]
MHKPRTVDGILRKLKEKSDIGGYLYRGEPEHYQEKPYYGKVSSNLYRVFLVDEEFDIEDEQFDIKEVQREMLEIAKPFIRKTYSEIECLAEIQHYGGKTNLIDFSEDYLIALYMACNSSLDKNGRVITQRKELIDSYIKNPYEPMNRVIAQKSVFVRHPKGFIQPNDDDVINILASLKIPLQEYLKKAHGIYTESVYNDVHGFIRHQNLKLETYRMAYKGLSQKQKGDSESG